MPRSDLPFGSEFSPEQIELPALLQLAHEHNTNWEAFEIAVQNLYFSDHSTSESNKRKLANNTKLALRAYGIISSTDFSLTDFGMVLYASRGNESFLYEEFTRHILKNCQGVNFVQCILDMQAAGENITLNTLRRGLKDRGIEVPRGSRNMSTLRLWLQKGGVFVSEYRVNQSRFRKILGMGVNEIEELAALRLEQRDYLKTIANMDGGGPHHSNDIEKLATATYGTPFNEKGLARDVLHPLRDAGYITLKRGTKGKGRGAKPFLVTATKKLKIEIITPILEQLEQLTRAELRPLLRKHLGEIRKEMKSSNRHIRGLALEALAFKLMRLVDLSYVATRLRGASTGGAEVDLIFEGARLVFSRWQIQCKNTKRVSLDDVAKEVGLSHSLKSNVIVMVSTGTIGPGARNYADKIMSDTNLCIIALDGKDLDEIEAHPSAIVDVFDREARHAMDLKRIDIEGSP